MVKIKKRKNPKSKLIKYKVTSYQIQIKGPKRNEAMKLLFSKLVLKLEKGQIPVRIDRFGTIIRCVRLEPDHQTNVMTLKLVKYNSIKSGIAWDLIKKQVVEDKDRVSAQQTDLLIYPNEHIAYHVHKTHGPTPSQIETYISHIFNNEKIKQKLDCEIDILPLKVGGAVKKLSKWRKIKSFAIEVIRPNPNGAIGAKRLKGLLESSAADKVSLQLNAKISEGLNKANISDLINEGDKIVSAGQGRVIAEGINENNQKDSLDSKDVKVKYNEIRTNDRDRRSLAQIILSFFGHIL